MTQALTGNLSGIARNNFQSFLNEGGKVCCDDMKNMNSNFKGDYHNHIMGENNEECENLEN